MSNNLTSTTDLKRTHRLEALDWLRGLLAISIMLYHFHLWQIYGLQSDSLLGRLGIYGVSMFFILSGLSMAVVYNGKMEDLNNWLTFFIKRAFRILPLLWLAVAAVTIISIFIKHESVSASKILLNITGAFGFIAPAEYLNTGAWSIGNELVYYSVTPLLILAYDRSRKLGNAVLAVCIAIGLAFSFFLLDPLIPISEQWKTYINPFNNLFLYVSGIALFYNTRKATYTPTLALIAITAGLSIFLLYPAHGDQISIVTGLSRIAFCTASLLVVYGFYSYRSQIPKLLSTPLEALGIATYGVYLLHPIVNSGITFSLKLLKVDISPYITIGISSVLSVAIALAVYRLLESPMMSLGKHLSSGPRPAPTRS
ncbi:acyltransferase [Pseudomonas farsensis]|uniref:Acyltransferase n=1 Tax=Pseudomonas farsensis TaxID=2745492 RepID=A0ABU8QWC2_9PSED